MRRYLIICGFLASLVIGACDDGFDPKGSFERALSVYSVLRSTSDSQYVRVHATYDPPGFDPLDHTTEPDLSGATVSLRSDSGTVLFADSLVLHPDASRFGPQLRVFYAAPFRPERGTVYTLFVSVPGYESAASTAVVPRAPGEFRLTNTAILSSPRIYETQDINLVIKAPPEARGYLPRMFIEYEVRTVPSTIERREIPFSLLETEGTVVPQFPDLVPLARSESNPFNVITFWSFQTEAYRFTLDDIVGIHGLSNLRFRRIIVQLYMVDESVYAYYNIANGFRDEFSIRTDLPDYSNINNGVGVFGAISLDSLSIPVNSTIQF